RLLALDMSAMAPRPALEERRPLAGTRARYRAARRLAHREDVVAVNGRRGHAIRSGALDQALARRDRSEPSADAVVVVLAHEDDREPPRARHVHRLVKGTLVRGAVAEERGDDLVGLAHLCRPVGGTDCD